MQLVALQLAALKKFRYKHIFIEEAAVVHVHHSELAKCLRVLAQGNTLIAWKLDRLGRSLRGLISLLDHLKAWGVAFCSLTETLAAAMPTGRAAAVACGVRMGRKPKLLPQQVVHAYKLIEQSENHDTVAQSLHSLVANAV